MQGDGLGGGQGRLEDGEGRPLPPGPALLQPPGEQGGGGPGTHLVNGGVWSHVTCTLHPRSGRRGFLFRQTLPAPAREIQSGRVQCGRPHPEEPPRPPLG